MRRTVVLALVAFAAGSAPALAAPGDLDTSFGSGGTSYTKFTADGFNSVGPAATAIQSDGKILVAGGTAFSSSYQGTDHHTPLVARYDTDGTLDPTFATGGVKEFTSLGTDGEFRGIAVQGDGKIVLVGEAGFGQNTSVLVARLNSDGSPDTTFSGDGIDIEPQYATYGDYANAVAMAPGDKIVVGGGFNTTSNGNGHNFLLLRFNSDGTLDPTFQDHDGDYINNAGLGYGSGYVDDSTVGDGAGLIRALVVESDGSIVAAGEAFHDTTPELSFALARYAADGSLDSTFGSGGHVLDQVGVAASRALALVQQADGKLVAIGEASDGTNMAFGLARFTSAGALDTGYGNSGEQLTDVGTGDSRANAAVLQPDGKLLVAGQALDQDGTSFGLARYDTDGNLDADYGCAGAVLTHVSPANFTTTSDYQDGAFGAVLQLDGKAVVAGDALDANNGGQGYLLARYLNSTGTGTSACGTDVVAPDTGLGGPLNGDTVTTSSVRLDFTSSEPNSTFLCSFDNSAYAACSTPYFWNNLSNGQHTVGVSAVDAAGNVDQSPAERTFTVAVAPPPDTTSGGSTSTTPTTTSPATTTTTPTTTTPTTTPPTTTAPPGGTTKPPAQITYVDTTTIKRMPNVVKTSVTKAQEKIAAAGIQADVTTVESKKKAPKGVDFGDIIAQSPGPGKTVTSGIGKQLPVKLTIYAGPSGHDACLSPAFRGDLASIDLDSAMDLIQAKHCKHVNIDFVVAKGVDDPTVKSAAKDRGSMDVTVRVPSDTAAFDLHMFVRQGQFGSEPSFVYPDWRLTAGQDNVFGIQVVDRGGPHGTSRRVVGAKVLLDGHGVGADDAIQPTDDTGVARFGVHPDRAGTINLLVQAKDANGNSIFGFGQVKVAERQARSFETITGQRFTRNSRGTYTLDRSRSARARAASLGDLIAMVGSFFSQLGDNIKSAFSRPGTPEQKLSSAARSTGASPSLLLLGQVAGPTSSVIAAGGGNVIAAGGGNVIAAGGGNVIAAGGGNVIAAGGGNVIAAGGGNVIAQDYLKSGTGQLINLPGGGSVIAAGGGNVIAAGGGNVIAAGGGNIISKGGGSVIAAGGGN